MAANIHSNDSASSISQDKPSKGEKDVSEFVPEETDANINPVVADTVNDPEKAGEEKPAPVNPMHPSQFPDGGAKAWSVLFGAWCCLFVSFGWINCIGVFQDYYQTHQLRHLAPSTVAWIVSLETFFMFFGGPFIGKAYDNYGPRYLLLIGTFLHVFGLMMASISTKYYQFILAQGICSPIGASMLFYPAMSCVTTWFFKKRATAFGIMASGSSLGGIIFPIMVTKLIPQVGFGWSMRISAFLILALMVVGNLTVKSRIPPRPAPIEIMEFIRPLKEPVYSLTVFSSFLFFMGIFLPISFIILQAAKEVRLLYR